MKLSILLLSLLSFVVGGEYKDRFLEFYKTITDPNNGYFSPEGVPYHNIESLMVQSADQGHETDSEAQSYNVWLKAMYGAITGDYSDFNDAWNVITANYIPESQYNVDKYNATDARDVNGITCGIDPIGDELKSSYGDNKLHLMHWLLDTDNVYGFGNIQGGCEEGPSANGPSFIQIGQGTVWSGITYPTCDNFTYGGSNGFSWSNSVPNYQYSSAPDAEARALQAAVWASHWATAQNKLSDISDTLSKAAKLGDYLRYSFFDKYLKKIGNCIGVIDCATGVGKESAHYLLSWYVGWGGSIQSGSGAFSWRRFSSEAHIGYQNPVAAYGMANDINLKPKSPSAVEDWQNSLERQLSFYEYLQTEEGLFSGGVTNSWNKNYEEPPADVKAETFHGMWYTQQPNYNGSSNWFGMQSWTTDRLAQYYYLTGDETVGTMVKTWLAWTYNHTTVGTNSVKVPVGLSWTGTTPSTSSVSLSSSGNNIGLVGSIARTAFYYAAKTGDLTMKAFGKGLIDAIWSGNKDSLGVSVTTTLDNFLNVNTPVYIPITGWTGVYPNGDQINSSSTFISIRSWYKNDPDWGQVETYLEGGSAPEINYHRFWEQADLALAIGAYSLLFE